MIYIVSELMIGFSVVAAPVLIVAYLFFLPDLEKSVVGRVACVALLVSLAIIQLHHQWFLASGATLFELASYVSVLLLTPPAFFFFSREVLNPASTRSPWNVLHLVPFVCSFFFSGSIITPLAFVIGSVYSVWFALYVFGMRRTVKRFVFEMFFFGLFAVLAVVVLLLAVLVPTIGDPVFYLAYANMTGLAFVLMVAALIIYPDRLADFAEAARLSYANSTLTSVDVDEKLRALDSSMDVDKLYRNEQITLPVVAAAVELSPHQLSELVNTYKGVGFSRFIKEKRVGDAKEQLLADPKASILSVGLATGFRSQSSFYAAFHEIEGESPGAWRQRQG